MSVPRKTPCPSTYRDRPIGRWATKNITLPRYFRTHPKSLYPKLYATARYDRVSRRTSVHRGLHAYFDRYPSLSQAREMQRTSLASEGSLILMRSVHSQTKIITTKRGLYKLSYYNQPPTHHEVKLVTLQWVSSPTALYQPRFFKKPCMASLLQDPLNTK